MWQVCNQEGWGPGGFLASLLAGTPPGQLEIRLILTKRPGDRLITQNSCRACPTAPAETRTNTRQSGRNWKFGQFHKRLRMQTLLSRAWVNYTSPCSARANQYNVKGIYLRSIGSSLLVFLATLDVKREFILLEDHINVHVSCLHLSSIARSSVLLSTRWGGLRLDKAPRPSISHVIWIL